MKSNYPPMIFAIGLVIAGLFSAGCQLLPGQSHSERAAEQLHSLFADYDAAELELDPLAATFRGDNSFNDRLAIDISEEYARSHYELQKKSLAALLAINPAVLSEQDHTSYALFRYKMNMSLREYDEGFVQEEQMLPFSQFFSFPGMIAQLGSGESAQPFDTVKDYDNWRQRADRFPVWVDQAIANMRRGIEVGVVQPRIIVDKMLPQLAPFVAGDVDKSLFYQPIVNMPETFAEADRKRLTVEYRQMITTTLQPTYKKLYEFVRDEYRPNSRESIGYSALPNGDAWYRFLIADYTTTDMTAEQIHQLGKREVKRLFAEMEKVKQQVGFEGDMQAFFHYVRTDPQFYYQTREELLNSYRDLKAVLEPRLEDLFEHIPKAGYEVKPVESFQEKSAAAASYMSPSADGSRPGVFYVNTYDLPSRPNFEREALSLHEAEPGHHFQISIAMEQGELPAFRRWGHYTAYTEGWALYAESLGDELGLYTDPYQYFGSLYLSIWRANRLVVDTGIHHYGWTRQQAIDWMMTYAPVSKTDAVAEVERYIVLPGQALSYMIGAMTIERLRDEAQEALGDKFDIRAFHSQILNDGALPLPMLEHKVRRWVERQR